MRIDEPVRRLVETLWNYLRLHHQLAKADAILVLCSHDTTVAERAAQLFLDGWAPLLIFSGGRGSITARLWAEPEADHFARIAEGLGVPAHQILIENQSTNTGDNILFTRRLLEERASRPGQAHPGAKALHGAAQLRDIQMSVARQRVDRDVASGIV